MNDLSNQELFNKGQQRLDSLFKIASEARKRAVTSANSEAVCAADEFLSAVLLAHKAGLEMEQFAPDITPSFGGK